MRVPREKLDLLFDGDIERARLGELTMTVDEWREIERMAAAKHGLPPTTPPWFLIKAERFDLNVTRKGRTAISLDNQILLRPVAELAELFLQGHHERAHGWQKRLGLKTSTEADAWLGTYVLTRRCLQCCPDWWGEMVADPMLLR